MKKKIITLMLVIVLVASVLIGCDSKGNSQDVDSNSGSEGVEGVQVSSEMQKDEIQEYTISSGSVVTSFDPAKVGSIPAWQIQAPIYENLVRYVMSENGTASYEPGMAESWTVSDDGLTWTFKIRKEAMWADGTPLNAHDFEYTWKRTFDPSTGHDYAWMVTPIIVGGEAYYNEEGTADDVGVKALDDYTLEFKLNMRVNYFLQIASFPTYKPVKKDFVEKYGEEYGADKDKTLGNGPFVIESWNPGQELVYVPNPHYWNKDEVYLQKITRKIISEQSASAQALLNGELDAAIVSEPEWRGLLDGTDKFNYINDAGANVEFFMFNLNNEYLKNKKIRQALTLAFDRERHIEEVNDGFDFPAYSIVPSVMHAGEELYMDITKGESEVIKTMMSSLGSPKELLIEGLKEEGLDPDPSKVEITLMTRGTNEWSKKDAEWLKQLYADELGINLNIELTAWNVMWDNVRSGTYEIAIGGWTADVDDPSNLLDIFHTENGYYHGGKTGWSTPESMEFNKAVEAAMNSSDDKDRALKYLEAEKILLQEAVVAPKTFGERSTYRRKYIKGLYSNTFTYIDYVGVYVSGK